MKYIVISFLVLAALASDAAARDDSAEIQTLEAQWDDANLRGDAVALEKILADDFILTGDDGKVHTKTEVLQELRTRNIKYEFAKTEELKVILHGHAAVVSGRWRGVYNNRGRSVSLVERFTNVYVRRDKRWRCVASHGSAIK